ncbi:MAG TPA: sulfotransferase [Sphingomonas sp.]|nr:sulfotransferase [Sphingomonas sp.]
MPDARAPDVEALMRRASELLRAGRADEAIPAYRALLAARPDLPNSWYNLAHLLRKAGRPEEALAGYQQALDRGITQPEEVHLERALTCADQLGDPQAARAELERALTLNPRYIPALLNLGNLHEDLGEREAARAAYERVLTLDPVNVLALSRLADVARAESEDDPLLGRIRALIAAPGLPLSDKATLGFAFGLALDRIGAYDSAFTAYAEANRASCAVAAAQGFRYDRVAQERFIDRLIAAFPEPAPPVDGAGGDAPIFICGMFRSGSTLAEQILASHSDVVAGGELDLLPELVRHALSPYPEAAAAASPERLAGIRARYLAGVEARRPGARRITDKRPDNFLHIGLIKRLFPDARIVHTRRDPVDNALSIFFLHLDPEMAYAADLGDIAHWYGQYRRLMAHWRALYPDDILDLSYDALVAEPRDTIAPLLDFCGLGWEEGVLSFHETAGAVRTASVWQVREPLYSRSSGRARQYARHIDELRAALGAPGSTRPAGP